MIKKKRQHLSRIFALIALAGLAAAHFVIVQHEDSVGWQMGQAINESYANHNDTQFSNLLNSGVSPNTRIYSYPLDNNLKPDVLKGNLERSFFIGSHGWKLPLFVAASEHDVSAVQLLLKHGADPKISDFNGHPILPEAFSQCTGVIADPSEQISLPIVRLLVKYCADVNGTDPYGHSILSYAVLDLYPDAVTTALSLGARPTPRVEDAPLEYWHQCPERAKETLVAFAHGGPAARSETNNEFTWLQIALADNNDEAEYLLSLGFSPDSPNIPESSIVEAIRSNNLTLVSELIKHGADTNAYSNEFNERPIDAASAIRNADLVEELLAARAQVDPTKPSDRFAMSIWNIVNPSRKLYVAAN